MSSVFKKSPFVALSGLVVFGWMITGGLPDWFNGQEHTPQAILVLGGAPSREKFAAKFALKYPNLPVWVSSGSPEAYASYVFDRAGVSRDRIHLDYRAIDTVSNFTTLVGDLQARKIRDIYLITADYHMPRAEVIGNIVLGSRGIKIHPVPIPSSAEPEEAAKSIRDGMRSVFWLATGSTLNNPK